MRKWARLTYLGRRNHLPSEKAARDPLPVCDEVWSAVVVVVMQPPLLPSSLVSNSPEALKGGETGRILLSFFWCVRPLFLSLSSSYFLGFWCVHIFFFAVRLGWGGFQLDMDITSSNGSKLTLTPLLRGAYGASHGWTGDSIAFSAIYTG